MSDGETKFATVVGVDVTEAVAKLSELDTAIEKLQATSTASSAAMSRLNDVSFATLVGEVDRVQASLQGLITKSAEVKTALAEMGSGVGGGGVAAGMGHATAGGGQGRALYSSAQIAADPRMSAAKTTLSDAFAAGVFAPGEAASVHGTFGHALQYEGPAALDSTESSMMNRLRAFATGRGGSLAIAGAGISGMGGLDMLHHGAATIGPHLGGLDFSNPWHALGGAATVAGSLLFGRGAQSDEEEILGSMNANGGVGRANGRGYGPFWTAAGMNANGGAGPVTGAYGPVYSGPFTGQPGINARGGTTGWWGATAYGPHTTPSPGINAQGGTSGPWGAASYGPFVAPSAGINPQGGTTGPWGATSYGPHPDTGGGRSRGLFGGLFGGGGGSGGGSDRHSPGHLFSNALGYGLFAMPAYAASSMAFAAAGSAIRDMSDESTALQQNALSQVDDNGNMPGQSALNAQRVFAGNVGVYAGYGTPDMTRALGENFRLSRNMDQAQSLTTTTAQISRITGNDPATSQAELAPVYKAFGGGAKGAAAVSHFADIMAKSYQLYDVAPSDLETAIIKGVPMASAVGISTGAMSNADLDLFANMNATMMQNADISPATAQSAMRMFFGNLRSPAKQRALAKVGVTGTDLTGTEALGQIAAMEYNPDGTEKPGGKDKALSAIEALGGPRSGMYAEEMLRYLKDMSENTKKMADTQIAGSANTYVTNMQNNTMAGQMSQVMAEWSKMWSNPNSSLGKAVSWALGGVSGALNSINGIDTLNTVSDALSSDPFTRKVPDVTPGINDILKDPVTFSMVAQAKTVAAREAALQKALVDPATSAPDRSRLLKLLNTVRSDMGDATQMDVIAHPANVPTGTAPGHSQDLSGVPAAYKTAVATAAAHAGVPAAVIAAQIQQESGWNPRAVSGAGAQGIAQFMPGTAAQYNLKDPFNAQDAIRAEGDYMHDLVKKYGSTERALSAYNSGNPDAYLNPNFASGQTYNYVRSIMAGASSRSGAAGGWWNARATSDRDKNSRVLPVHSATDSHGKGIYASHPLSHDTDFSMAAGTAVDFGFSGGTFLGSHPYGPGHGWGNEMDFALDSGGYAKAIHLRSMQKFTPGQHVSSGDLIGTSGGVPGVDADKQYSSSAHLCWVTDDAGYTQLIDLTTGKARPDLAQSAAAQTAPHVDKRAHVQQITGNAKTTAAIMAGAKSMGVDPMTALALVRAEGGMKDSPAQLAQMFHEMARNEGGLKDGSFAQTRALIEHEVQYMNDVYKTPAGHVDNPGRAKIIDDAMKALSTWGSFGNGKGANGTTYSLQPHTGAGDGSVLNNPVVTAIQQNGSILQNAVDQIAQSNGYLSRIANFNVPSSYGVPMYEDYAARTAATPHKDTSATKAQSNAGWARNARSAGQYAAHVGS